METYPRETLELQENPLGIPMSEPGEYYTGRMRKETAAAYLNISMHLPGRTEKPTHTKKLQNSRVRAEFRTGNLPITSQKR
jgi:hypothetical protein